MSATLLDQQQPALALGREIAAAHPALDVTRWRKSNPPRWMTSSGAGLTDEAGVTGRPTIAPVTVALASIFLDGPPTESADRFAFGG
ncbi:hypothetical protein [Streptomyces humidus]|nr:hypothetical protein [Streptomyces humidus]